MLNLLLVLFLIVGLFEPAVAQVCSGLASFDAPLQIAPYGSFAAGGDSFGGRLAYGRPATAFGWVEVGTTSADDVDELSLDLGAGLGYQVEAGPVHVCPNVGGYRIIGPKNINGTGIDHSAYAGTGGVSLGIAVGSSDAQVVPSVGFDVIYAKAKLEDAFGTSIERSETFGQATLGLGLVFSSTVSLRPAVVIPVALEDSEPFFGLVVAFHLGPRRPRSAVPPTPSQKTSAAVTGPRMSRGG